MKSKWQTNILILLLFLAMALVQMFPLLANFSKAIPYTHMPADGMELIDIGPADALQMYYKFWLFKDSIVGRTPLLSDNYKFNTEENYKLFSLQLLPLSFLFFIFSFGGGIFAYNMTVVVTTVLTGFCAFLLVKYLLKSPAAGIIAGIIFMLIPFKYAQMTGGHPNGFLFFLVPLGLYCFERSYREGRILYGFFSGLCLLSLALIESHMIFHSMMFYGLYVPCRYVFPLGKAADYRPRFVRILKTVLPIGLCLSLFALNVLVRQHSMVKKSVMGKGRRYSEVLNYSPGARDLADRLNKTAEKYVYVGILPPILAGIAAILALLPNRRKKDAPGRKELRSIMIFMGAAFLLSCFLALGPRGDRYIGLYRFLYKNFPYFKYPRVPGRIFILSALMMSTLAGFAIVRASEYLKNMISRPAVSRIVAVILFAVIFAGISADYLVKQKLGAMRLIKHNRAYEIVRKNLGDGKLLELPIWPGDSSWEAIYLYYVTLTRARLVNGYSPMAPQRHVEKIYKPLKSLNIGEINEEQYRILKRLGVKYVMLHQEGFPPKISRYPSLFTLENLRRSPYLKFVAEDQPVYLFEMLDTKREIDMPREPSSIVGRFLDEKELGRNTGGIVIDEKALGGKAIYADEADSAGFLAGRYKWSSPSGRYRAIFRLKAFGNDIKEPVARLAVKQGDKILISREVAPSDFDSPDRYSDFELKYEVKFDGKMESVDFRVEHTGAGRLWFDYVYILFADQQDTEQMVFEAEQMFHIGETVYDREASDEKAVEVTTDDPRGNIAFGLNRRFAAGRYRVNYRIKVIGKPGRITCEARVVAQGDGRVLNSVFIFFPETRYFNDVILKFTIDKPEIIDFPVYFRKNGIVYFDKIEISRIADEQ